MASRSPIAISRGSKIDALNSYDYKKVKEIFNSALEIEPEGRDAFLDQQCGDEQELRDEVERLLRSYDEEYLESPAVANVAEEVAGQAFPAGHTIGHYTLVRQIGVGGMGEVYLAEDGKLGRRVAIKLLPETFIEESDRLRRFEQEARTASALNHPNILTVFEIGETGNTQYIATEYIDGETLRARLNRGRLPIAEALDIAVQCASAVAAAHENGIIHRDIKPENIMLRQDNLVKVLDFGLAKLDGTKDVAASPDAKTEKFLKTAPGMIMGTVQYMSPEQTRGHATDARTDIWSLGVVIYEMLAGGPPFAGENSADLIAEIVKSEPAKLSDFIPEIPAGLDEIVLKAIQKRADDRYQSAKDLCTDLNRTKKKLEVDAELSQTAPARRRGAKRPKQAITISGQKDLKTVSSTEYLLWGVKEYRYTTAGIALFVVALLGVTAYLVRTYWATPDQPRLSYLNNVKLAADALETSNLELAAQLLADTKPKKGEADLRGFEWGYLSRLHAERSASQPIIVPQEGTVHSVAFSPDGNSVATAGTERIVRLWDVNTGQQISEFAGHEGWLVSVAFSPDGRTIASGAFDKAGGARLWDVASGAQKVNITTEDVIGPLEFLPDGKTLVGNDSNRIKFWNATDGVEKLLKLNTDEGRNPFAVSHDGKLFAARQGIEDRALIIWDFATGKKLKTFRAHNAGYITDLEFSNDTKFLLTGSTDGTAKLWDVESGKELMVFAHADEVWKVAFARDGKIAATGSKDKTVKVWDTAKGFEIATLKGHRDNVRGLAFSPDGSKLASGGDEGDKTLRIWNVPRSDPRGVLRSHTAGINRLAFSRDGKTLASGSDDKTVKLWDVESERERLTLRGHTQKVSAIGFSPNGTTLATAGEDHKILFWDVLTGKQRPLSIPTPKPATVLNFSPDGRLLATGHWWWDDREVRVWDAATGALVCSVDAGGTGAWSVEFSKDSKQFITVTPDDAAVRRWDTATCGQNSEIVGPTDSAILSTIGADGKLLTLQVINNERSLKMVDLASGEDLVTFRGHETELTDAVFSPDARRLVTGDKAGILKIWDVATGQDVLTVKYRAGDVNQPVFSPDGDVLAIGSVDGSIRLLRGGRE